MNVAITLNDVHEEQIQVKNTIYNFSSSTKLKKRNEKDEKDFTFMSVSFRKKNTY